MKQKTVVIVAALAVLVAVILMARYGFTAVETEDAVTAQEWDPVASADEIWVTGLPAAMKKAVKLPVILSKMKPDANGVVPRDKLIAVTKKYGLVALGERHVYMVKGSGKIVRADTETSRGVIEVIPDRYSGPIKVLIYIGPSFPSNEYSIMDVAGFNVLEDVPSQLTMGGSMVVLREINKRIDQRIMSQVLGNLDRDNLMGKSISFIGAFSIHTFNRVQIDLKEIHIVPVEIEMSD